MTTVTAQPTRGQPPGLVVGGVVTAQAIPGTSGGLEVLNLLTGGPGFERVLTLSDIGAGVGDVVGPGVSVDDRLVTFDGVTGKLIQDATTITALGNAIEADADLIINASGGDTSIGPTGALGQVNLYANFNRILTTDTQGIQVLGQSVNNPIGGGASQTTFISLRNRNDQEVGQIGLESSSTFRIHNQQNLGAIELGVTTAGVNFRPVFTATPLGDISIEADGEVSLKSRSGLFPLIENARTAAPGLGGFFANNTLTGAGLERVLTTSDIGSGSVPLTRTLTAGAGLTGGGDLTADRTFDVGGNADGSIVVNADDIQVGVLATDAQHGTRGGGSLHAAFNASQAGFAPQSPGGTNTFLRADGTWATPPAFGEYVGTFDASVGTFPGGAGVNQGDWYNTLVAGTVDGEAFNVGDLLVAQIDSPSTTTFAGNWTRIPNVSTADVQGPASATDNAIARYDGTTCKLIQNSLVTIDDSGNVTGIVSLGIGGAPDASAALEIDSTTQGFLFPRLTTGERNAIVTPATGLVIYNTDTQTIEHYNGTAWVDEVPSTRVLTAGAGMTGGGDLSADRTFNVVANADGSIVVNADDVQVGVLATDAQHGTRGGGTLHAEATTSVAGFLSAADKTKLDAMSGVFGSEFEEDFAALEQSTTSPTYVTPYSYTTASLPAGDYKFEWLFDAGMESDKAASHRVTIDGVEVSNAEWRIKQGVENDGTAWFPFSGHRILTLTAGTHTIAIQYRAANTAYIRNKQVSIFRVA